jgi:hypothetical protein
MLNEPTAYRLSVPKTQFAAFKRYSRVPEPGSTGPNSVSGTHTSMGLYEGSEAGTKSGCSITCSMAEQVGQLEPVTEARSPD